MTYLIGIDVGSTHCKAGAFALDQDPGLRQLALSARPTPVRQSGASAYLDPEELWATVVETLQEVIARAPGRPLSIGIASMAESGLLVERSTGLARSRLLPWFDTASVPYAARLENLAPVAERFIHTGVRPTFKCSLAKLLWLKDNVWPASQDLVWLSAADWIAFRFTGQLATELSLAGRTYAFDLDRLVWDTDLLQACALPPDIFPPAAQAGALIGRVLPAAAVQAGLPGELFAGLPVTIAGHDHLCAAFAAGVTAPGQLFDSLGTAETLLGVLPARPLTTADQATGLSFGYHVVPGLRYWLGGLSASGGSVEWLRSRLNDPALTYAGLNKLLEVAPSGPTGILYFPYLLGSGSPHSDPGARAAFIGLAASHTRSDLAKAVLEGTAYELEYIRQVGQQAANLDLSQIQAAGGGTRNAPWMQIKADVTGCQYDVLPIAEATVLGAALLGGVAGGYFTSHHAAAEAITHGQDSRRYLPDPARHQAYQRLFTLGYLPLEAPLRALYQRLGAAG